MSLPLSFASVSHRFGAMDAVSDFSVEVAAGEFVAIMGPSGCGKSTLLRLAAGLLSPSDGSIVIDGVSPLESRKRNGLSFVFQSPTLLPWRTVRENISLPLELDPRLASQTDRSEELIALVGLSGFAGSYPAQLSGGMKMRAALARALVSQPDLIFFDEPFAALDEFTREALQDQLLALWKRSGATALFVTHNVFEAVYLASRVIVMSDRPGRIVGDFPVAWPYPRPEKLRTSPALAALAQRILECL